MNFGEALQALKDGRRVARAGWNGKGMLVFLVPGNIDGPNLGFHPGERPAPGHPSTIDGVSLGLFNCREKGTVTQLPYLAMRSASGSIVTGWLASQTDMLAEDWDVLAGPAS